MDMMRNFRLPIISALVALVYLLVPNSASFADPSGPAGGISSSSKVPKSGGSANKNSPVPIAMPCATIPPPDPDAARPGRLPQNTEIISPCPPATTPPIALPSPPNIGGASAPQAEQQRQVILKGLKLVGSVEKIQENGVDGSGIIIENLPILETPEFRKKLQVLLGQPVSPQILQTVGTVISDWYRDHDYPFVDIAFPAGQDITNGTLQLVVTESRTGKILAHGNKWFSTPLLTDQVRLAPGDRISLSELEADKDWLNQNSFRQVNIVAQKSASPGYTDFTVETTQEEFPLRFRTGYDDNGVQIIGRDEWSYGLDWGNALWLDQQLSYTFTSSKPLWGLVNSKQVNLQEHTASDSIPLPWHDNLVFLGSYAQSTPNLGPDLGLTGINYQVGMRYVWHPPTISFLTQQIQFGFDFKSSNNNLEFGGIQVSNVTTDIYQFSGTYSGAIKDSLGQTSVENNLVFSPGNFSDRNSDQSFAQQASFATAKYIYDNLAITRLTGLPQDADWVKHLGWFGGISSLTRLTGQIADTNLLPSEQLGLGGTETIPGYDERTANGSQGVFASEELLLPAFSISKQLFQSDVGDQTQFSGFWSYGNVQDRGGAEASNPTNLESAGVGLRFVMGRYVNLRANYGFQLRTLPGATSHGAFGHVALNFSY